MGHNIWLLILHDEGVETFHTVLHTVTVWENVWGGEFQVPPVEQVKPDRWQYNWREDI